MINKILLKKNNILNKCPWDKWSKNHMKRMTNIEEMNSKRSFLNVKKEAKCIQHQWWIGLTNIRVKVIPRPKKCIDTSQKKEYYFYEQSAQTYWAHVALWKVWQGWFQGSWLYRSVSHVH